MMKWEETRASTRRKPTMSGGSRTHAHMKHSGAQYAALTTRLPDDPETVKIVP